MCEIKEIKKYPIIGTSYYHYKGGSYTVLTLAKYIDNQEDVVIYKSNEFGSIHVRPLKEWFEIVKEQGKRKWTRFSYQKHSFLY